jgi:hypothetical protein
MKRLLTDSMNRRIQKYIPGDSAIVTLVKNGTNLVSWIKELFLDDEQQNLYYCDVNGNRIQKLSLIKIELSRQLSVERDMEMHLTRYIIAIIFMLTVTRIYLYQIQAISEC